MKVLRINQIWYNLKRSDNYLLISTILKILIPLVSEAEISNT